MCVRERKRKERKRERERDRMREIHVKAVKGMKAGMQGAAEEAAMPS